MKQEKRIQAVELRQKGCSLKEISEQLSVSKSTVSGWVKGIVLTEESIKRLNEKITNGQIISAQKRRTKTENLMKTLYANNYLELRKYASLPTNSKFYLGLLHLCEGGKTEAQTIRFTNSDPKLIVAFLRLLRISYNIDETKFRVCLHLHEYHDVTELVKYWSELTDIPIAQFIKPYLKKNTRKNIHEGYKGCVQIRYYDTKISRDLITTYQAFLDYIIGS